MKSQFWMVAISLLLPVNALVAEDKSSEVYSKLVEAGDGVYKVELDKQGRVQSILVVGSSRISTVLGAAKGKEVARQRAELNAKAALVKWLGEKVAIHQKTEDETILFLEGEEGKGKDKDTIKESGKSIEKTEKTIQSVASSMLRGMKIVHVEISGEEKNYTLVMKWDVKGSNAAKELSDELNQGKNRDEKTGTAPSKKITDKRITIDDDK